MPANTMWKRTVVAVLGVAIAMTGCSAGSPGPGPEAAVAVGSAAWSAQCDQVAAMPTTAATGLLAVVTDLTSSQRALQSAPALNEALAAAQKVGWALIAVGVNGSGGTPGMVGPMLLDPSGGQDSVTGDRARVIGLGCAEALLDRNELKPTSAGSDQLAAIAAALRQKPDAMVISSDGVPVGGLLDINTLGWEPDVASAVDQVIASPVTLPPAALPITWVDLAETSEPMPDAARATLTQLWQAVLGAEKAVVTIDTRLGPVASAAPIADPADAFRPPGHSDHDRLRRPVRKHPVGTSVRRGFRQDHRPLRAGRHHHSPHGAPRLASGHRRAHRRLRLRGRTRRAVPRACRCRRHHARRRRGNQSPRHTGRRSDAAHRQRMAAGRDGRPRPGGRKPQQAGRDHLRHSRPARRWRALLTRTAACSPVGAPLVDETESTTEYAHPDLTAAKRTTSTSRCSAGEPLVSHQGSPDPNPIGG
jgi:hypothetical protein